jgi:preprotein translocase subunit SecA
MRDETVDAIGEVVDRLVETHASAEHPEEWDVDTLETEVQGYWPTELDADRFAEEPSGAALYETLASNAIERYEEREDAVGDDTMRQVERQIMLRLIDQRWREHLQEMDYLRDGIHLRAMGQKDPATEWQTEGFQMFGHMINAIDSEYVRYIMHVEVKEQEPAADAQPAKSNIVDATAEKAPAAGSTAAATGAAPAVTTESTSPEDAKKVEVAPPVPKLNTEFENVGRNAPCPCGSGSKFKHCHGR